jgi:hypothetical protein
MMRLSARYLALALLLLGSACATETPRSGDSFAAAVSRLPRYPACSAEIDAFVAMIDLARQAGDRWQIFEPALDALKDQLMDCVEESYPTPLAI